MSIAGIIVCIGLLLLGLYLRAPLIVSLFGSFAFGSTAIATLGFLGNSSPLIYTVFAGLLLLSVLLRRNLLRDITFVLSTSWIPWLVIILLFYAAAGAIILPRVFAGQTSAFVPSRESMGMVFELPLAPVSGNVTQAAYFALGIMVFLAVRVLLTQRKNIELVQRGFFTFCVFLAAMGLIDLMGKLVGAGDVFLPIRSANYVMHTNEAQAGFSRITAGYSEASTFGSAALGAVAFTFTYWRRTASSFALVLTVVLSCLIALSTSTTAYVGAAVIAMPVMVSVARSISTARLSWSDLMLFATAVVGMAAILAIYVYSAEILAPFIQLFESAVLNKSLSGSAYERTYWNMRSLQTFFDTTGLGIGLGSSRSSNWIISVFSQLGLIGAVMMSALIAELVRGVGRVRSPHDNPEFVALHDSARAFALAGLVAATISGGGADPGMPFFIALATVLACRDFISSGRIMSAAGYLNAREATA